jgi:hypothetical protein
MFGKDKKEAQAGKEKQAQNFYTLLQLLMNELFDSKDGMLRCHIMYLLV